jgi:hypothetical protein
MKLKSVGPHGLLQHLVVLFCEKSSHVRLNFDNKFNIFVHVSVGEKGYELDRLSILYLSFMVVTSFWQACISISRFINYFICLHMLIIKASLT